MSILDGNEAAASVAYRLNEVIAIYPITPSSPMGEWSDQWNSEKKKNIWGAIPDVWRCRAKAAPRVPFTEHFQGVISRDYLYGLAGIPVDDPYMYKIAGELTAAVIHVAARNAWRPMRSRSLVIISDVMSTRGTGFALLSRIRCRKPPAIWRASRKRQRSKPQCPSCISLTDSGHPMK